MFLGMGEHDISFRFNLPNLTKRIRLLKIFLGPQPVLKTESLAPTNNPVTLNPSLNDTIFGSWERDAGGDWLRTLDYGVDTKLKDSLT